MGAIEAHCHLNSHRRLPAHHFLGHARNKRPVASEHSPADESTPPTESKVVSGMEQPIVHPELALEPDRMIKVGADNFAA